MSDTASNSFKVCGGMRSIYSMMRRDHCIELRQHQLRHPVFVLLNLCRGNVVDSHEVGSSPVECGRPFDFDHRATPVFGGHGGWHIAIGEFPLLRCPGRVVFGRLCHGAPIGSRSRRNIGRRIETAEFLCGRGRGSRTLSAHRLFQRMGRPGRCHQRFRRADAPHVVVHVVHAAGGGNSSPRRGVGRVAAVLLGVHACGSMHAKAAERSGG